MKFIAFLAVMIAFAMPLQAQEQDIQKVISSQLQSFMQDDFDAAFSHAAPNIKQIFQTPERFAQMVTNAYPMVHRPAEVQFQGLVESAGVQVQDVLIRDRLGEYYLARYSMIQNKGVWQIMGVNIVKAAGVGA